MKRPSSIAAIVLVCLAGVIVAGVYMRPQARTADQAGTQASANAVVKRQDLVRGVRLSGTVEAVQATTITTPRLAGQNNNTLVVMTLVRAGQSVRPGDLLVEFDRQD